MVEFSLTELEEAWVHVEDNHGCPGVDAVSVERFARDSIGELKRLLIEAEEDRYKPLPLLQILVEKHPGSPETRRLLVPSVRDRILQTAACRRLTPALDVEFVDASFGYRPGRGVDAAIARIGQLRERGFHQVLQSDFEDFFDRIPHGLLLQKLTADEQTRPLAPLLARWVNAFAWDGDRLTRVREGIAQGSPLSPLFANFFLEEFDVRAGTEDAHLVRYGDDFLLLCATADAAAAARSRVAGLAQASGLKLNAAKTALAAFDTGFHFLGAFFLGDHVYTPWKAKRLVARAIRIARPMPARLLMKFLKIRAGRPPKNAGPAPPRRSGPTPVTKEDRMAFLYVTEQGSAVRKSGDRVLVEREGQILVDLPYHKLENVLLFGNVQLTSAAMTELLDHGIRLSLFSPHGRFRGALTPPAAKNVELRLAQFDRYRDALASFELARQIVRGKIANGIEVLRRYARRNPANGAAAEIAELGDLQKSVANMANINALDGCEGAAAHRYFTALMRFHVGPLPWPGRLKHPAPDPVNALLSLVYTMVLHELQSLIEAHGLDAYLGFLHQLEYGRPSLALDLLEAFRHPVADRLVLTLLNRGQFRDQDFFSPYGEAGVALKKDSLRRFFESYEAWMVEAPGGRASHRRSLELEIEGFGRHLKDGGVWQPYSYSVQPEETEGCST